MSTHPFAQKTTQHFKNVLVQSFHQAALTGTGSVTSLHLLFSLLGEVGSIGQEILHRAGATREMLAPFFGEIEGTRFVHQQGLSPAATRILERAILVAAKNGHTYIGTEHLLAGLLESSPAELNFLFEISKVKRATVEQQLEIALKSAGKLPELLHDFKSKQSTAKQNAKQKTPALEFFATELTTQKVAAKLDPVIGRDEEIERLIHVLCRRTKNNPLLLGDPGVGKTAIVEGLAKRIVDGAVPAALADKRIFSVDLGLVIAGTMYRGEFEGRIKQLIDEVKQHPEIILFIDEVHSIVGAGSSNGTLDAANLLKPALARGELHVIGATTFEEFKKHIEHDAALERRFQTVMIKEPTADETIEILKHIKSRYESFHHVAISDEAIVAATKLSHKYFPEKHYPDKAIDLIDEAMSAQKVERTHLETHTRRAELRKKIIQLGRKKQEAVIEENFDRATALQAEESAAQLELSALEAVTESGAPLGTVTARDMYAVLARITRRPLAEMSSGINARGISALLTQKVFGQSEALTKIAATLAKAELGLGSDTRPLASFLFVGPTGTGKSEVAKLIAAGAYGDPKAVIHLSMTEFSEGFSVSKLLGSPAGYVGHKESTTLVDRLRRQPLSVIVFDEIDKAHGDVLNILLQMLEEGRLTDSSGKEANVKQCIIILTHQIPYEEAAGSQFGFGASTIGANRGQARTAKEIEQSLRTIMKPELLNRIDSICVFQPLTEDALAQIAGAELADLATRVSKRGIALTWDDGAPAAIAKTISSAADGARSVRHATYTQIEQPLIDAYLAQEEMSAYHIESEDGIIRGIPTYGRDQQFITTLKKSRARVRTSAKA